MKSIRLVICEDDASYRKLLAQHFEARPGFEVRSAADPDALLRLISEWMPEVILFDLYYRRRPRFDAVREIRASAPATKILPLTYSSYDGDVKKALEATGTAAVDGYLTKDMDPDQIEAAIIDVLQGRRYIDPMVGEYLLVNSGLELTAVERLVLQGLADGKSHEQIAEELPASEKTGEPVKPRQVRRHEASARRKLAASNTNEAISIGHRRHILH